MGGMGVYILPDNIIAMAESQKLTFLFMHLPRCISIKYLYSPKT